MNVAALTVNLPPPAEALGNKDARSLGESCEQFEAVLWRQLLDGAMQPLLAKPPGESSGAGVYQYFLCNTLAESVSGRPDGFSSLLQAQLAEQAGRPAAQP